MDQPVDLPKTNFLESKSWFLTLKSCFLTPKNCFLATGLSENGFWASNPKVGFGQVLDYFFRRRDAPLQKFYNISKLGTKFQIFHKISKQGAKFQKFHNDFKTWYKISKISKILQ